MFLKAAKPTSCVTQRSNFISRGFLMLLHASKTTYCSVNEVNGTVEK